MESLFEQTRSLLNVVTEIISYFRAQNYYKAFQHSRGTLDVLQNYLPKLPEEMAQEFLPLLKMSLEAMERQEGTKVADIYEEGFLPLLYQIQQILFETSEDILKDYWGGNRRILRKRFPELYRKILECRENISDRYQVSWAKTGDIVLDVATEGRGSVQICSMYNPWQEAMLFTASAEYEPVRECLVIGFGLGYHLEFLVRQLQCQKIIILENDLNQLAVALSYRNLSYLLADERVVVIHCEDKSQYLEYFQGKTEQRKVYIWYPSVKSIENTALREMLEDYSIEISSINNMKRLLEYNFSSNIEKNDKEVTDLQNAFQGKKVIFTAGGPSLNENIEVLKHRDRDASILVCVGKMARRLIASDVIPDYIIMTDGMARTKWQINGIESRGIPLIYLSTAAANVVEDYQGKRYIAFQEGFPLAEKYAAENKFPLYQSGGSVATFALDMLLRFRCSKVICVGLDLGYPGERTHALGIGRNVADKGSLRKVEGISSEFIYTSRTLDIYRTWIERRIQGVKDTELINVSGGARIHGMREGNLNEFL